MLTVTFDETTGIVCTSAEGLASIEEFDSYLVNYESLMAKCRRRHGQALHLVDAGNNPVQARDSFSHMAKASEIQGGSDLRCAVIMRSALARMQLQRLHSGERRYFEDRDAAVAWLLDYPVDESCRRGR